MIKCSCGKYANFNVPEDKKPIYCAKCKTEDMIDVVSKRCPCGRRPSFNVPGKKKPTCCKECKTEDMISVVSKRCSCGNRVIYNVPGEKPICCAKCKTDKMINVVSKKCSCGKIPKFNNPGEITGICCKECKTSEMVDVIHTRCLCGKMPKFNVPGEKPLCCSKCKTDEMIDVVHKRCLCGKICKFNVPEETKGVCCSKCKTFEMVNVVNRICPGYNRSCPVRTYISNVHEYCMSCDPNEARRKRYKQHEEAFFDYVKDKLDVHQREFRVTFDPDETSKKFARLDGIVFGDGIIVCLEVDEDGHEDYECDEHRMHLVTAELLQKYSEYVVSWVRVNPTVDVKNDWSKKSKKIREKRFEDVVNCVNDILETKKVVAKYIGFE